MSESYYALLNINGPEVAKHLDEEVDELTSFKDAAILYCGELARPLKGHEFDYMSRRLPGRLGELYEKHKDPRGVLYFQLAYSNLQSSTYKGLVDDILGDRTPDPEKTSPPAAWAPIVPGDHVPSVFANAPSDSFEAMNYQIFLKGGFKEWERRILGLSVKMAHTYDTDNLPAALKQKLEDINAETGYDWRKTQHGRFLIPSEMHQKKKKLAEEAMNELTDLMGQKFADAYKIKLLEQAEDIILGPIRAEIDMFKFMGQKQE